jgi:hypothetical protein
VAVNKHNSSIPDDGHLYPNTVCRHIAHSQNNGARIDGIIDFSKPFNIVPCDRPLKNIASAGVDFGVVV